MSAGIQTRAVRGVRPHSLFYRDLGLLPATDTSSGGGDVGNPNQVTAALWRANDVGGSDPPPPPFYTLEDRIERSPEANTNLSFHLTPQFAERNASSGGSRTVLLSPSGGGGGACSLPGGEKDDLQGLSTSGQEPHLSKANSWWSPRREMRSDGSAEAVDRDGASPMSGVIQQQQSGGGLLTLSLPGEIVRPDGFTGSANDVGVDGEGWVTVFGFSVDETNSVIREFEKCGRIVNHVSGPGGANWVHLQYLNHYDAQKALMKNGIQLNSALLVGVKRLDPLQSQGLTEKAKGGRFSFTTLPPRNPKSKPSARTNYLQTAADSGAPPESRQLSVIASPAKSTLSKLVDLVFGM